MKTGLLKAWSEGGGHGMPGGDATSAAPWARRLRAHLRTPLYRNGYAMILSSGGASALGIVYWIAAARFYSQEAVGLNSAALSAMFLVGYVAQLNFPSAINRFLPTAGVRTRSMIIGAYVISTIAAISASSTFLLAVDLLAPALRWLKEDMLMAVAFVLGTAVWSVFAIQESVLLALRRAGWIPVNAWSFGLGKLGLVAAFAALMPTSGIFFSWIIPAAAMILAINHLIFRHFVATAPKAVGEPPPNVGSLARFQIADYVGSVFATATASLLPIMVVNQLGAEANAIYFLAWTIAYSLYLISRHTGMSLIAEAARRPDQLEAYVAKSLAQTVWLVIPAVAVIVVAAPYLLLLFGGTFAEEGTLVLRLICLSAVPGVVTNLALNVARATRNLRAVVLIPGGLCAAMLSFAAVALMAGSLVGVAFAVLAGQLLTSLALLSDGRIRRALTSLVRPSWSAV